MNIVITGGNSFIGQALQRKLIGNNIVIGVYNSGNSENKDFVKCNLVEGTKNLDDIILQKNISIDCILHTASEMAYSNNLNNIDVLHNNVKMAFHIGNLAKRLQIKHLINFSSSSVYSNNDGLYSESNITEPHGNSDWIYGLSKLNTENIFNAILVNEPVKVLNLRICNVYGEGMNETRLIPVFINELKKNNTITLFGNGERIQNIISIDTLVKYVTFCMKVQLQGTYNIVEESVSTMEIAKRIIEKYGDKSSRIIVKAEGNKSKFILEGSKFSKLFCEN